MAYMASSEGGVNQIEEVGPMKLHEKLPANRILKFSSIPSSLMISHLNHEARS